MKTTIHRTAAVIAAFTISGALTLVCLAGKTQKWDDVPEAVRKTILANGGTEKSRVDLEGKRSDGKAVYEAEVKDKDGSIADLVITSDGKLVKTKHDDAADAAAENAAGAKKKDILAGVKFSHPREITNPWLPLASLKQDILEGTEDRKKIRIERTMKPDIRKTFKIGGVDVEALVMEDREFEDGELTEVTLDYFAQSDDGTVYYLGEDVDEYKDGKVSGHSGAWMFGKDTQTPGVIIPGNPKVGDRFKSEDVSATISESDEVVSVTDTVTTPAGTYHDCVRIREALADGSIEFKCYAKGVGVVREQVPPDGDVLLKSHEAKAAK